MVDVQNSKKGAHNSIDGKAEAQGNKQTIEELTKRYTLLNTKKIQAETNLDNAEKELTRLKDKARSEYNTDNVDELKIKLEVMEAENERKRSEYQRNLDKIEAELNEAEKKYAEVKDGKET
jgi:hypothetical protein